MDKIKVKYHNEVFLKIETVLSVYQNLWSHFSYMIADFHFKKAKNPNWWNWDGKIRLFDRKQRTLPYGLIKYLYEYSKQNGYKLELDDKILNNKNKITDVQLKKFIKTLKLPYELYDYQYAAVKKAIIQKKITFLSPTSSGKSLMIYVYLRYFMKNNKNEKIILIVPNIGLADQMVKDFKEYGYKDDIHAITSGVDKDSDTLLYISTWQSVYKLEPEYFEKFKCLIIDEVHGLKNAKESKAVIGIANNTVNASYRLGTTGTIDDHVLNQLQIEALLGPIFTVTTSKEMMDNGQATKIEIRSKIIEYDKTIKKQVDKLDWEGQLRFVGNKKNPRNYYIIDLAKKIKGNTLILFSRRDHGTFLYEKLMQLTTDKTLYYVDGNIDKDTRTEIRAEMEKNDNVILVASFGTFSTGMNIRNLHNLILASSTKSKIRILQSLGRTLRLHSNKDIAYIYDIVDDIKFMFRHYEQRLEYYVREYFEYVEERIELIEWFNNNFKKDNT
jgi:superfamily II DNA or RNA helicase